jgi:hypothetical protein
MMALVRKTVRKGRMCKVYKTGGSSGSEKSEEDRVLKYGREEGRGETEICVFYIPSLQKINFLLAHDSQPFSSFSS